MLKISDQSSDYLVFEHDCDKKGSVDIIRIEKDELGHNWEMKYYCRECGESEEYKIQISGVSIPEIKPEIKKEGIPLDGSAKLDGTWKLDGTRKDDFNPDED